jgi:hypothetical protein
MGYLYHRLVSAPNFKMPTITTPVTGVNYFSLLFPTRTNQYVSSFLCSDMEAVLTLALMKPQCTKSTTPNIYNSYKNFASPSWPPQEENR